MSEGCHSWSEGTLQQYSEHDTHVALSSELKVKEIRSAIKLKAARLKSWSENVDALRRDTISANWGCLHVPGEGGGAGEGAGAGVTRGVDGRGIKALIMDHVLTTVANRRG